MQVSRAARNAVSRRVRELVARASDRYSIFVPEPKIQYTVRGTAAGRACTHTNVVALNPVLLLENFDEFVEHTVGHEVAHIAVGSIYVRVNFHHGREWQQMMSTFSLPPRITHNYDVRSILNRSACKPGQTCLGTCLHDIG